MEEIKYEDYTKIEIRVGTIKRVKRNTKANIPAYILEIDFGDELGTKITSAQVTENYGESTLLNLQVAAVVNFPIKRIAGVKSEVLLLAGVCSSLGSVVLTPTQTIKNGSRVL